MIKNTVAKTRSLQKKELMPKDSLPLREEARFT